MALCTPEGPIHKRLLVSALEAIQWRLVAAVELFAHVLFVAQDFFSEVSVTLKRPVDDPSVPQTLLGPSVITRLSLSSRVAKNC